MTQRPIKTALVCQRLCSARLRCSRSPGRRRRATKNRLRLAKSSYFFVGGKIDTVGQGSPMFGQMYVEYMIPENLRHPYPVVMVHGGSQTGTNFTGTPDGREGWAQYFVRRGYAVYVVDQVGRGRSAYWAPQPYGAAAGRASQLRRGPLRRARAFNMWPQAKLHNQFPGSARPGDVYFDQFYASQFPSIVDFTKQQEINRNALVALLDKIGPGGAADSFAVGRHGLAGCRQPSEPGQGDHRSRAERPARP